MSRSPSRWEWPGQSIPPAGPASPRLLLGPLPAEFLGIGARAPAGQCGGRGDSSAFQRLMEPVALSRANPALPGALSSSSSPLPGKF